MNIYVINKSTVLEDAEVISWIPAFNVFLRHVRGMWPRSASLVWCPKAQEPAEAWKVVFADTSDQAGALGYHDFTPGGRPISYVFAKDDIDNGYSPTVTATHEISEMIADPWISDAVQVTNTKFYAKEIADPVEDDSFGYNITVPGFSPVLCSDFVYPNWFIPGATGKLDQTGKVTQPLQLLQGGYMSVFVSGKGWTQIFADKSQPAKSENGFSRLERYGRDRPESILKGN